MGLKAAWWWIDRWRTSSAYTEMSLAEMGAYRNLCDELWVRDGCIPNVDRILARSSGSETEWPGVRDAVLAHFKLTDEGWRHEVHDKVMGESKRRSEKQKRYRNSDRNSDRNVTRSLSLSPSPSPRREDLRLLEDSESVRAEPEPREKKKPQPGPQDQIARELAAALGSSLNPCRKQVAALVKRDVPHEVIRSAIEKYAIPGDAPWDWVKKARTNDAGRGTENAVMAFQYAQELREKGE